MGANKNNSWVDVEKLEIQTPLSLVEEQAKLFNDKFDAGQMVCCLLKTYSEKQVNPFDMAELFKPDKDDAFMKEKDCVIRMMIKVPSLDNYTIQILKISYKISQLYPCELVNSITGINVTCENQESFKDKLLEFLTEDSISKVLATLLSQI